MTNKTDYDMELDYCEYNPVSLKYENELKTLAKIIEIPAMSMLQKMMKKIILAGEN